MPLYSSQYENNEHFFYPNKSESENFDWCKSIIILIVCINSLALVLIHNYIHQSSDITGKKFNTNLYIFFNHKSHPLMLVWFSSRTTGNFWWCEGGEVNEGRIAFRPDDVMTFFTKFALAVPINFFKFFHCL